MIHLCLKEGSDRYRELKEGRWLLTNKWTQVKKDDKTQEAIMDYNDTQKKTTAKEKH